MFNTCVPSSGKQMKATVCPVLPGKRWYTHRKPRAGLDRMPLLLWSVLSSISSYFWAMTTFEDKFRKKIKLKPDLCIIVSQSSQPRFYFLAASCSLRNLSSLTRDWAHALGSESTESSPLDDQGISPRFWKQWNIFNQNVLFLPNLNYLFLYKCLFLCVL